MKLSRSTGRIRTFIVAICGTAIQMGDYPEWELGLQLFDEAFADQFRL